jgi:hypothetical protein
LTNFEISTFDLSQTKKKIFWGLGRSFECVNKMKCETLSENLQGVRFTKVKSLLSQSLTGSMENYAARENWARKAWWISFPKTTKNKQMQEKIERKTSAANITVKLSKFSEACFTSLLCSLLDSLLCSMHRLLFEIAMQIWSSKI